MDDHIDLFAKIKCEPEEREEVWSELVLDANNDFTNETNELEIEQSELGILGNIMKSYDHLSLQSRIPGQVEFFLDDSQYSYIITVKRLENTAVLDEATSPEPDADLKFILDPKLNIKTYSRTHRSKNVEILNVTPEIPKRNDCETNLGNITNVKNAKSEIKEIKIGSLNDKVSREETFYSKYTQANQSKTTSEMESVESPQDSINNSSGQLNAHNIVAETQNIKDFQIMENADDSTTFENTKLSFEGDEQLISEDEVNNEEVEEEVEEEDLNEISDVDKEDNLNSDGSSDSEADNTSLMDSLNDMLITNQIGHPDKLLYQCKICNVRTSKINQLNRHIRRKHRNKETSKEQIPDKVGCNEIVITDDNVDDKSEVCKQTEMKRIGMTKNARKRDLELQELLDLLNTRTKTVEPFSNKNETLNDAEDEKSDDSLKCTFCDYKGDNQIDLYRHIGLHHAHNPNEHHKKGKLRTDCVFCPFKGSTRKSLLLHLRTKHRGGKGYECGKCKYNTHHKSNFDRHVEVVHDKKRDVKCEQCGFLTTRNYLLEKHVMYKHQGIMPYKCPEEGCDYGSTSSSSCKAHTMEVHKNIKPFVCTVASCDFSTSRRFVLKNHLFKEHGLGDPPSSNRSIGVDGKVMFQCPHCEHQASQRGNLQKHIRTKHLGQLKRFKCAQCDYTASEKHFVNTHIAEVHLGQFLYSCHLCKFKCSLRQRFQRHFSAVHLGQRPYHCDSCDYKATQPVHLQRHIEVIHKGEKPHFCIYCKFNTAHRANLRAHLKSIHRVSDQHLKEVLLSCVDMRVRKRKNTKGNVQVPVVEELGVKQGVVPVNENLERMADGTVVMVPGVVALPQQPVDNVDDLEALEASLVLEKISQQLNFGNGENAMEEEMETLEGSPLNNSQVTKVVKPLRNKLRSTQSQSPKTRNRRAVNRYK